MNEVDVQIPDLHDSEIDRLDRVCQLLEQRSGTVLDLEAFRKEAIERFAEVGFKVDVKVYDTNQPGLYAFDLIIAERLEGQFDPDQQVWEVTNDILGLGEGGVIKTGSVILPKPHHH